jgi:hypothetical protein
VRKLIVCDRRKWNASVADVTAVRNCEPSVDRIGDRRAIVAPIVALQYVLLTLHFEHRALNMDDAVFWKPCTLTKPYAH